MARASAVRILVDSSKVSVIRNFNSSALSSIKKCGSGSVSLKSVRYSEEHFTFLSRLPAELGCAQSLMPLHSITASALFSSLLSQSRNWSCLSEGFATPL